VTSASLLRIRVCFAQAARPGGTCRSASISSHAAGAAAAAASRRDDEALAEIEHGRADVRRASTAAAILASHAATVVPACTRPRGVLSRTADFHNEPLTRDDGKRRNDQRSSPTSVDGAASSTRADRGDLDFVDIARDGDNLRNTQIGQRGDSEQNGRGSVA
jgi:hypothetical protein